MILIETGRPDSMNPEQQPVDRMSYHTANEKAVLMFNKVLANSAHEYAYASQRDELPATPEPEPQPWGAVTRRAVAQRRSRAG